MVLACLIGCADQGRRIDQLYDAARHDVWRGAWAQATARVDEAEAALGADRGERWWKLRLLRAEILVLKREIAPARALLEPAPPATPALAPAAARRTYLLAQSLLAEGKLQDAIGLLGEARQQAAAASADEVLLDIDVLHGQALLRSRRWAEADALLQDAIVRAQARGDTYRRAAALVNLGMGRVIRSRFDEALPYFETVLEMKPIEDYTVYGTALTNAGLCYARLGQFEQAIAAQTRAVSGHEKRGATTYLEQALGELGNTHMLQGKPREGLTHLSRAYEVATAAKLDADAAVWAGNVAVAAVELGDLDHADRFNREAIRLKAASKGNTLWNTLNAASIAAGRGKRDEAKVLFTEALQASGSEPAARWEAHAGLANTLLAAGDAARATVHFEAALGTIRGVRAELLKPEYRLTFLTRVIRFYQQYVDTLVRAGSLDRALLVSDSSRAVVLAERMGSGGVVRPAPPVTADRLVTAAGRSRTIWLAYWLAPAGSHVWVVTGSGIHHAPLPPAADIDRLVQRYRTLVEGSSADPLGDPAGAALYAALIAPISRHIPPGASVRIVADGTLHGVNFETLPVDGGARRYWIEDVTVAVAPSLALLAHGSAKEPDAARSLLLVGDPTPRLREFPRLGYAQIEMGAVSKHFDPQRIARYEGDRASPAEYLAAQPERYSVIHFTAHGAANRTSPLDSAVILAGPPGADKLYARDVAERLLRADLVTISACRSAGDRAVAGEGLIGFSWAFLRAGARQVVAGLWDVDDQSTARLMDGLYAGMARGESPVDALRAAKLSLMRQGGHLARPYYWGPFELFTITP